MNENQHNDNDATNEYDDNEEGEFESEEGDLNEICR